MEKYYIAVLAILLLPQAFAASVTDISLLRNGGELTTINPALPQVIDVVFLTDAGDSTAIRFDLSALGGSTATITGRDCVPAGEMRECTISDVSITRGGDLSYSTGIGGSFTAPQTKTISLTVDAEPPSVASLTMGSCVNSTCYIGSEADTQLQIEVTGGPVETGNIFYRLGGIERQATNCSGNVCSPISAVRCRNGEEVSLEVLGRSTDDAGNPFSERGSVTAVCDALPPDILRINYNGTGIGGAAAQGSQLLIRAEVRETSAGGRIIAGLENVQEGATKNDTATGACRKVSADMQECIVSIGSLTYGEALQVPITIVDGTGQQATGSVLVNILQVANATEVPDFFRVQTGTVIPERINRVALELALQNGFEFQQMIPYRLEAKESGVRVLHQQVLPSTCRIAPATGGDPYRPNPGANWSSAATLYSPLQVFNPTANYQKENRIDGKFLRLNAKDESNIVVCNISLVVAKYNKVYVAPEMETLYWPLELQNSQLGTPGGAFLEKIEQEEQNLKGGVNRVISTSKKVIDTMTHVCQIQGVMNQATNKLVALEGLALSMSFIPGAGAGLAGSIAPLTGGLLTLGSSVWGGSIPGADAVTGSAEKAGGLLSETQGVVQKMCHFVHCDIGDRMKGNEPGEGAGSMLGNVENRMDSITPDALVSTGQGLADTLEGLKVDDPNSRMSMISEDIFSDLNTPDVGNSLIMSMATGCFPGVVDNLYKYQEINCGYLLCLKEQAMEGHSVTPCEEARGAKMCTAVVGEVFELPYARIGKNLMSNINNVVQQAGVTALKLILKSCPDSENSQPAFANMKAFGCRMVKSIENTRQFSSVTSFNQFYSADYSQNLCAAALCEGEGCEKSTNSYAEQSFFPGYIGRQWPQRQEQARLLAAQEAPKKMLSGVLTATKAPEVLADHETLAREYEAIAVLLPTLDGESVEVNQERLNEIRPQLIQQYQQNLDYLEEMGEKTYAGVSIAQARELRDPLIISERSSETVENIKTVAARTLATQEEIYATIGEAYRPEVESTLTATERGEQFVKANIEACQGMELDSCREMVARNLELRTPGTTPQEIKTALETVKKRETYRESIPRIDELAQLCNLDLTGQCQVERCNPLNLEAKCDPKAQEKLDKINEELNKRDHYACSTGEGIKLCSDSTCTQNCMTEEEAAITGVKGTMKTKGEQFLLGAMDLTVQWAASQGHLDTLTLGGWGDWGQQISGSADKILNPEQWKVSLCNPRGDLNDLTSDQSSVYLYQRGAYRPVLTFAAERLEVPDGYLYTTSVVITSTEYDTIRAEVTLGGELLGNLTINKDEQIARSYPVVSPSFYEELCVTFDKSFPAPGDGKTYCRDVRLNAYDRGAPMPGGLPEYGSENPWDNPVTSGQDLGAGIAFTGIGTIGGAS